MFKAIFNGCICLDYKSYENFESYRIHSKELHAKRFLFTIWLIELVGLEFVVPCAGHTCSKNILLELPCLDFINTCPN